ncbi:MAG TPA: alpha/beta hydrolase [SAR202 cluster bacterium]|nr:alpha/beta hydrolase [SAR202 cluster bacterium]MDP7534181.1 alpha/beta hydrolase [SAR202 cluster bacterium]HJO80776.1 alpha/beta hydrolase [SAR202 cluster bacterium]
MRQAAISFRSKRLTLDGVISTPGQSDGEPGALVVCHSHPTLGGDMTDAVVMAICEAADSVGMATLRFNFRGVGDSEGQFTNGDEEGHDVKAAVDTIRRWPGIDGRRVAIAGYSLGAAIILDNLKRLKQARAIVVVAPTVESLKNPKFAGDERPRLVVAGQNDKVAPSLAIQRELDSASQPLRFAEMLDADHSMRGHESMVGDLVAEFVAGALA